MPRRFDYGLAMQRLREGRGGKCERCASRTRLEFAHLTPTKLNGRGRGRANRYHDVKNNPAAYALLCKSCHAEQELDLAVQRIKARPVLQVREPGDDTGQEDV